MNEKPLLWFYEETPGDGSDIRYAINLAKWEFTWFFDLLELGKLEHLHATKIVYRCELDCDCGFPILPVWPKVDAYETKF